VTRQAFTVRAGDGAEIVCTAHEPAGPARSTVVIAPNGPLPRAGPFRSMARLADHLCGVGHRVVRADLRGFGEAEADVPEATIYEHYRSIERGLHVDDLLSVVESLDDDGAPLVLFGGCGEAFTAVRAAAREERVHGVVAYALPVVLTGGRGAELAGRQGPSRGLTMARLGIGEAVLRASRGRLLAGGLAPWLNAELIRALRGLSGARPVLLLFGGDDDIQDQLARYGLDHLEGVDVEELPGIGHHFDDPDDVERVALATDAWLGRLAQSSHAGSRPPQP
jgi:pimeloyl-ACP methyl ester carboxylesterase